MCPTRPPKFWLGMTRRAVLALVVAAAWLVPPAAGRPLEAIRARGLLSLCAHPNALPFASKRHDPPGFQIELGRALAERLGVALTVEWVTSGYQYRRADCDIILDTILDREAQEERRLRLSKPYHVSGVALALPRGGNGVTAVADLAGRRVGVQMGSIVQMLLSQRGVRAIPFGFEDDMIEALAGGEIHAAAISPLTIGYFNLKQPERAVRLLDLFADEPELNWQVGVGLRRSDRFLRRAIDRAIGALLADGTVRAIYARYGIEHRPPGK
jgi:polar amino acid transport system substrate-binding protein